MSSWTVNAHNYSSPTLYTSSHNILYSTHPQHLIHNRVRDQHTFQTQHKQTSKTSRLMWHSQVLRGWWLRCLSALSWPSSTWCYINSEKIEACIALDNILERLRLKMMGEEWLLMEERENEEIGVTMIIHRHDLHAKICCRGHPVVVRLIRGLCGSPLQARLSPSFPLSLSDHWCHLAGRSGSVTPHQCHTFLWSLQWLRCATLSWHWTRGCRRWTEGLEEEETIGIYFTISQYFCICEKINADVVSMIDFEKFKEICQHSAFE